MAGRRPLKHSVHLDITESRPIGASLDEEALQKNLRAIGEGVGGNETTKPITGGRDEPIGMEDSPLAAGTYQGPITTDRKGRVIDAANTGALPEVDQIQRQLVVGLVAVSNSTPTEDTSKSVGKHDLRYFDEVRVTVKNSGGGSGATCTGQYWDGAVWQSMGASVGVSAAGTLPDTSAWATLAAGARADVAIRVLLTGGASDIDISYCALEFRRRGPAIYNERIGVWSSATAYQIGNIVERNGSSFVALQAHTNQTPNPAADTAYWGRLAIGYDLAGALAHTGSTIGFFSTTPATQANALTLPGSGVFNTGDAATDLELANMFTRQGEIEAVLARFGFIPP